MRQLIRRIHSQLTVPRPVPTLDTCAEDENLGDEAQPTLAISWDIPDPRWQEFMAERYLSEMDSWDSTSHPEKIEVSLNHRK